MATKSMLLQELKERDSLYAISRRFQQLPVAGIEVGQPQGVGSFTAFTIGTREEMVNMPPPPPLKI